QRLDQLRGDLLLAGRVGTRLVGRRALEEAARRDAPDEGRVVGDRRAIAPLRRQVAGIDLLPGRDAGLLRLLQRQLADRLRLGGRRLGDELVGGVLAERVLRLRRL